MNLHGPRRTCIPRRLLALAHLHDLGEGQEFGADFQVRLGGGIKIDFKAKLVGVNREIDDSARGREVARFADGQGVGFADGGQNPGGGFFLAGADEDHLTTSGVVVRAQPLDGDGMARNLAVAQAEFKIAVKRVCARHADQERRRRIPKSLRRPIDELGEVLEKRQLDPVLAAVVVLRGDTRRVGKHEACGKHSKRYSD